MENIALQESILSVAFILDFLIMKDIITHLAACSKSVQRGRLPWIFPETKAFS